MIQELNKIGGLNGIGRVDMIEDRMSGFKSREIYEAPAASILFVAHRALESMVLDRHILSVKEIVSSKYTEIVYRGKWYSPLRGAMAAFIDKLQKRVTGRIKIKLYKGNIVVIGRDTKYSLCYKDFSKYR